MDFSLTSNFLQKQILPPAARPISNSPTTAVSTITRTVQQQPIFMVNTATLQASQKPNSLPTISDRTAITIPPCHQRTLLSTDEVLKIPAPENIFGEEPPMAALREGNLPYLKRHLEKNPHDINQNYRSLKPGEFHNQLLSLLHVAVLANEPEMVEYLLTKSIDVNAQLSDGHTALMLAARHKDPRSVANLFKLLSQFNPDINLRDQAQNHARIHSPNKRNKAKYNGNEVLRVLMGNRDRINDPITDKNRLVLSWCCLNRPDDITRIILEHGADPNIKDPGCPDGKTPFLKLLSLTSDHSNTLALLHQFKADFYTTVDNNGNTGLHLAIKALNRPHAQYLLDHGFDANTINKKTGDTALTSLLKLESAEKGKCELICEKAIEKDKRKIEILKHQIKCTPSWAEYHNPQIKDLTQRSLTLKKQCLTESRNKDVDEFNIKKRELLKFFIMEINNGKINANFINSKTGESTLYLAIRYKQEDLVQALISAGADPHKKEYHRARFRKTTTPWGIMNDEEKKKVQSYLDSLTVKKQRLSSTPPASASHFRKVPDSCPSDKHDDLGTLSCDPPPPYDPPPYDQIYKS